MALPQRVCLTEVAPRDGLQSQETLLSTSDKLKLIGSLVQSGLSSIQVTSFVHPERVPQLADADALIPGLPQAESATYNALTLNRKGIERAAQCGLRAVEISISASEAQSRSNTGMSLEQAADEAAGMAHLARDLGLEYIRGSIQCVFGYDAPGDVPFERVAELAGLFRSMGVDCLLLADTTGLADPPAVKRVLQGLGEEAGDMLLGLHLHDTFGLGLVNLMAGLEMGIASFDTALGGIGGCPFLPGAAGNIATEEAVFLLHRLGVTTGIDLVRLAECRAWLEHRLGKAFPGRITQQVIHRLGKQAELP